MASVSDRVVFFNIGWMKRYQGLDGDDIQGGGSYVTVNKCGHEVLIF